MTPRAAETPALGQASGQAALAWEDPPRGRAAATSPVLAVDGFEGPLDWLLELARTRQVDLARLSILALVEAFVTAMQRALERRPGAPAAELARWAGWTVMAAQLTELRSRLLLPNDDSQARTAQVEAEALRRQWIARAQMAAAADWLQHRPQLGHEVFARGRPEPIGAGQAAGTALGAGTPTLDGDAPNVWFNDTDAGAAQQTDAAPVSGGDLTELLRACLVALRLPAHPESYQLRPQPFWSVGDATRQITRLLPGLPQGADLTTFLPEVGQTGPHRPLHCRAAVAATLLASLELTRTGRLTLEQDQPWTPIQVQRPV